MNQLHIGTIIAAALFFLASCGGNSGDIKNPAAPTAREDTTQASAVTDAIPERAPETVAEIQQAYKETMAAYGNGSLDSVSFQYSCYGEKEGTVSYFSTNGRLRMIVHEYGENSHYGAQERYFVKDSTLFFVYVEDASWSFDPDGPEGSTKDNVSERRIYLADGKPFKCLEKKYVLRSASASNPISSKVPNKEIDCSASGKVSGDYKLLLKHRARTKPAECLE
jgi:hypothetical protein